jgi:uncharacterized protein (TIGR02001 family)
MHLHHKILSALAIACQAGAAAAANDAPARVVSGKVSLLSEYEYRGIAQSSQKPALQIEAEAALPFGFYGSGLASTIRWLKDFEAAGLIEKKSSVELRLSAGYRLALGAAEAALSAHRACDERRERASSSVGSGRTTHGHGRVPPAA